MAIVYINPEKQSHKPCLLCRIIGHKWVSLSHYRIGEREAQRVIVFGCCARCGKPTPHHMFRGNLHGRAADVPDA